MLNVIDKAGEDTTNTLFEIKVESNTKTRTRTTGYKSWFDTDDNTNTRLEDDVPFGIIGIDNLDKSILVDNKPVFTTTGVRTATINTPKQASEFMTVSAVYPYIDKVSYYKDGSYAISFTADDLKMGALLSDFVSMKTGQESEVVNLNFNHITNNIGFKICDITADEQLQGHMRVRKIILHGMPTEGTFFVSDECYWIAKSANDEQLVFYDGNDNVEVGVENAKWLSSNSLSDEYDDGTRFYVVPEVLDNKHVIEVVFDVDEFEYDGTRYSSVKGKSQFIPLCGVIPDDSFELGLKYSFVLGMNLCTVYRPISFCAVVDGWENQFEAQVVDYDHI